MKFSCGMIFGIFLALTVAAAASYYFYFRHRHAEMRQAWQETKEAGDSAWNKTKDTGDKLLGPDAPGSSLAPVAEKNPAPANKQQ